MSVGAMVLKNYRVQQHRTEMLEPRMASLTLKRGKNFSSKLFQIASAKRLCSLEMCVYCNKHSCLSQFLSHMAPHVHPQAFVSYPNISCAQQRASFFHPSHRVSPLSFLLAPDVVPFPPSPHQYNEMGSFHFFHTEVAIF